MQNRLRVLIIAFPHSIHTARWIKQLDPKEFDTVVFPSLAFRPIHEDLKNVTLVQLEPPVTEQSQNIKFKWALPGLKLLHKLVGDTLFKKVLTKIGILKLQRRALKKIIHEFKPDLIHTMESQQAGYMYSDLPPVNGFRWIHSTWGIDLHFFQDNAEHKPKLQKMLQHLNLLVVEGDRDREIAERLGYKGSTSIIPSVGGGFDFSAWKKLPHQTKPSSRKKIIVKGYEGEERLASTALEALRSIATELKGFEVVLYSCGKKLLPLANSIQNKKEFNLTVCDDLDYNSFLKLVCESRISITNNLSDGVPNTMLEAMASGTFPIQSNTAITCGWIEDGFNGLITEPRNIQQIAESIKKSLLDDELVDKAADHNRRLVREKLDISVLKNRIKQLYQAS